MPPDREGSQMLLRRTIATAAGAVVLAAPLSSCGFDYATDQSYNPAVGINEREEDIDILSAAIVAGQSGSGTLTAGVANNATERDASDTLVSISAPEGTDVQVSEIEPIELGPEGFVQLAEEDVHVTGAVEAGDVLPLVFEFESGLSIETDVSVTTNCDEFEGYDTSGGASSGASGETGATEPAEPEESVEGGEPSDGDSIVPGEGNASASPDEANTGDPYSCEFAVHEEGH